jgi:uncharacterized membrane protein YvbJ
MANSYNWTCTACGAANAAGTDICRQCGSNAVTSASAIESGANKYRAPPLSPAKKVLLFCCITAVIAGVMLFRITSNTKLFLLGLGLIAVG